MLPYVIYDSTKQGVMHFDGLYQTVLSLKETGNFKTMEDWQEWTNNPFLAPGDLYLEMVKAWDESGKDEFYIFEKTQGDLFMKQIVDFEFEDGELIFTLDRKTRLVTNKLVIAQYAYL